MGCPLLARHPQGLSWPSRPVPSPERQRQAWCPDPGPRWWEPASPGRTGRAAPWSPAMPTERPSTGAATSWLCSRETTGNGRGGGGGKGGPQGLPDHRLRRDRGNGQRGPQTLHLKGLGCPAPRQMPAAGESWGRGGRFGQEGPGLKTHQAPAVPGRPCHPAPQPTAGHPCVAIRAPSLR